VIHNDKIQEIAMLNDRDRSEEINKRMDKIYFETTKGSKRLKMKKLRLWNGRPYKVLDSSDYCRYTHISVAAYSRADARRVCVEAGKNDPGDKEIKEYWNECWGKDMAGITPERGLWVVRGYGNAPERIKN